MAKLLLAVWDTGEFKVTDTHVQFGGRYQVNPELVQNPALIVASLTGLLNRLAEYAKASGCLQEGVTAEQAAQKLAAALVSAVNMSRELKVSDNPPENNIEQTVLDAHQRNYQ